MNQIPSINESPFIRKATPVRFPYIVFYKPGFLLFYGISVTCSLVCINVFMSGLPFNTLMTISALFQIVLFLLFVLLNNFIFNRKKPQLCEMLYSGVLDPLSVLIAFDKETRSFRNEQDEFDVPKLQEFFKALFPTPLWDIRVEDFLAFNNAFEFVFSLPTQERDRIIQVYLNRLQDPTYQFGRASHK